MSARRLLQVNGSQLLNLTRTSTGELMKDCGWDQLVCRANKWKENEKKDNRVAMKMIPEPTTGLSVPLIEGGSENLAIVDETPEQVREESVAIIRKRPKMVTQQGTNNVGTWELRFATKERWENPCMGWCSTGCPVSGLSLFFRSSEDAAEFACRHGWAYQLDEEKTSTTSKFVMKNYADNFVWNRRTRVSTK